MITQKPIRRWILRAAVAMHMLITMLVVAYVFGLSLILTGFNPDPRPSQLLRFTLPALALASLIAGEVCAHRFKEAGSIDRALTAVIGSALLATIATFLQLVLFR